MRFSGGYFRLFLLLLAVEISIAIWVHDDFVRPYIGDVLVVGLVYCFVRSFFKMPTGWALTTTLLFAFSVEFLQLLDLTTRFDIRSNVLQTVLGTSFSWADMVCYLVGGILILLAESKWKRGLR